MNNFLCNMSEEIRTEELIKAMNDFEEWAKDETKKWQEEGIKIDPKFVARHISRIGMLLLPTARHTIQLEKEVAELKEQLSKH